MKKVVLIAEAMLGGIRQHVFDIARGLDKKEYEVYLIYSDLRADDTFFEEIDDVGRQVKLIKCNEMQRELGAIDFKAYKAIKKQIEEIKPDIVHCHSSKAGIVGRMAAKKSNVPMIIYTPNAYAFQNPDSSELKKKVYILAERYLSKRACTYTINVSKGEMDAALQNRIDKPDKFKLIYNGIPEIDIPNKKELKERLGLNHDVIHVGFTGRCAKQKDPFTFLEIAEKVTQVKNNVEFVYIGDGELEDEMKKWIKNKGLSSKIHMMGFRKDSSEIVGAFDVYLSTALYEGLPYSMLEAMRAGIPLVATDCVGNNELVFEGKNGYIYPIKNVEKGVSCILSQIDNGDISINQVRDTFVNNFSLACMLGEVKELYAGN